MKLKKFVTHLNVLMVPSDAKTHKEGYPWKLVGKWSTTA
jgi:hypothetical protein